MTTLVRRNLNLMKSLCRWRLYLNTFPKEYNFSQLVIRNLKDGRTNGPKYFATVPGFKTNLESGFKENPSTLASEGTSLNSIDEALTDLDYVVKRTGRTVRKTIQNILSMVEDQGFVSHTHSLYLLRACTFMYHESPKQRVEYVDEMWRKLLSLGCQFDIGHFNSLLRIYVENNHDFSPSEFLATMEKHKIDPNKATFLHLLDKYASDGNINGTSEVLEIMKDKGLPINEAVFNTLIKCHMKARDTSGARDILQVMRSSYAPSADTYTALACGYAEQGEIKELKSVLQEAEGNNISLDVTNYLSIISSLPAEHSDFVDTILAKMDDVRDWKQDVLNCMIDLISKNLDQAAYKLLLAISSKGETNPSNNFVKQLIKSRMPVEKVIDYCEKIYSQQLNELIFVNSAKAAIDFEHFDYAETLFDELNKKGVPIRGSFFWRLFEHHKNSEEGIWSTLKKMYKLGIPPDFRTFEEYIFPYISLTNPQAVISKVQETGLSLMAAIDPLFHYYCRNAELDNALYLLENYPVRVYASFDLEKFLSIYDNSRFISPAYCNILSYVIKTNKYLPEPDASVLQGKQLALLIQKNPGLFQTFLKSQQRQKDSCKFSQHALEVCWDILKERSADRLVYLKALERTQPQTMSTKTAEEEERELSLLVGRGNATEPYLIDRLYQHLREKNIQRAEKVRAELDKLGVIYPPVLYAQLLSLYCEVSNIDEATNSYHTLKEQYPTFALESNKAINYAELLIKFSKFDEAKKIIEHDCQTLQIFGRKEIVVRSIKRLFLAAIETGDCELVKSIQGSLVHHSKQFESNNIFYEPLIKVHLYRNDLESAINEFRSCVTNHKVLPCLSFLLKKCITNEDQQSLKTVVNIASGLVPEHTVLFELALGFMDTGRRTQALKVIQSIKNKANPAYIEDICSRLYDRKLVTELEEFLLMIQDVDHLGKEKLFYNLFRLYDEKNDYQKGRELYEHIEKQHLFDPSDRIKNLLLRLLARNKQSVPFSKNSDSTPITNETTELVTDFLECVDSKNVSQALEKLQNMKKGIIQSISLNEITKFVDLLVQEKRTSDIISNNQAMSCIIENANDIVRPLLEKYSASGDIESLKSVASFLPDFSLKKMFFNTYYTRGHFCSEKYEDLLLQLENNQANNNSKLFCIAAFEGFLKRSEYEERVIKLAKGYLDVKFDLPIAVVWAHYVTNRNYEKANEFLKLHPVPVEKVDSMVLKVVRQDNDIDMGKLYLDTINQQNTRMRTKERAYGTVLDVLVMKNQLEDAVALFTEAKQNDVNLEKNYRSTLVTLKRALEKENKEAPFTIQSKEFDI